MRRSIRYLPLKGGGSGWESSALEADPRPTASRLPSPLQGKVKKEARAARSSLSQEPVRPHHGAPHVRRGRIVEAEPLLRLAEVAPDDVDEIVQVHLHVRI